MKKTARLTIDDLEAAIELPVYSGSAGPQVIDVRGLASKGLFTYDPGFMSTAACESRVTFIDGEQGVLLYRGYPIEELAEHCDYLDACHLILKGELPNSAEKKTFVDQVYASAKVDDQVKGFFKGFRNDAHPMAMLSALVAAQAAYYHASTDINDFHCREQAAIRIIAQIPVLAAMCYKHSRGEAFVDFDCNFSYADNFLHMMFGKEGEPCRSRPVLGRAMDRIFLLHADHEQNASTSTVRLAGSTGTNPYSAIAAGIAALWGPAHGGANEAVLRMLKEIGNASNLNQYLARAKDPDDSFRLMGFGHRVYKNFDPRAKVLRQTCDEVLEELGIDDPLLNVAHSLSEIAREDPYFIERKLYPNVDFYSGIILRAIGIPEEMFTVIFAIGRSVGWISHWHEMLGENYRIGRPRQLYTGHVRRHCPALGE